MAFGILLLTGRDFFKTIILFAILFYASYERIKFIINGNSYGEAYGDK